MDDIITDITKGNKEFWDRYGSNILEITKKCFSGDELSEDDEIKAAFSDLCSIISIAPPKDPVGYAIMIPLVDQPRSCVEEIDWSKVTDDITRCFYCLMFAVDPEHRGKKTGLKLVTDLLLYGKLMNYAAAYGFAEEESVWPLLQKLGAESLERRDLLGWGKPYIFFRSDLKTFKVPEELLDIDDE